jgi:hypothetical protein
MLTPRQREHFAERGFVRLPGVFSRDAAAAMERRVWEWLERHHGVRRDDPTSWTLAQPTGLQPLRRQAVFDPNGGALLLEALDELLGAGCWKRPREWGGFLVSFPSAGATRARAPWHTDFDYRGPGDRVFGALVFSYLCDVPAGAGGTLVVAGSPRVIRRFVEGRPRASLAPMKTVRLALMHSDPWLAALAAEENAARLDLAPLRGERSVAGVPVEIVELSGEAGDVVVGHPWLLHRGAPNRGERPRFMRVQRVLAGL